MIIANAPHAHRLASRIAQVRTRRATGKSALTNSFPSCPAESSDDTNPVIMYATPPTSAPENDIRAPTRRKA